MSIEAKRKAIIIGAGPAGLTAALELLRTTDVIPVILEAGTDTGGISKTVNYKGNRIDIGGHRFFSKSDTVLKWWLDILPLSPAAAASEPIELTYHNSHSFLHPDKKGKTSADEKEQMLVRPRKSRIYFNRKFINYPVTLSGDTISKLGYWWTCKVGIDYAKSLVSPIKPEKSLEDFYINRFGAYLYRTFFQAYTEKIWGVPCNKISPEWGKQRVKGLSILQAVWHIIRSMMPAAEGIAQKKTETSLIEKFLYPALGPGQLWEKVAELIKEKGGTILYNQEVRQLHFAGEKVVGVTAYDPESQTQQRHEGDFVISTMPVKDLVAAFDFKVPSPVFEISQQLLYRDFITVGLLLKDLKIKDAHQNRITDNWIYLQEPSIRAGRLQVFNNWSPYMVQNPENSWIGVEYFCYEGDDLWQMPDEKLKAFAAAELASVDIIDSSQVLDATVIRVKKAYPAYFGAYARFEELRNYLDRIENLFLIGRNGMHKYNNQDHSMLTAMAAVQNIKDGRSDKANIWEINTEQEYHEEKGTSNGRNRNQS
ncbi:NAD(P)/FAD-dependent oxidoreductase [Adhaeribacter soli]|uniref:NAD(P)/FAD-dependent oxidoreductase n=1 Tax=Adhaeribacter soli TaxID=2607655 RepID=A0A5N1IH20_9BACT|nr:NAD(P)/FAD-dependent oxidoreductase [Adhaeribacter soli]KAA9324942.1 NAD(P)/FAD-dependent oxidoreductase [Adhaeribacter soli]